MNNLPPQYYKYFKPEKATNTRLFYSVLSFDSLVWDNLDTSAKLIDGHNLIYPYIEEMPLDRKPPLS